MGLDPLSHFLLRNYMSTCKNEEIRFRSHIQFPFLPHLYAFFLS
jgi:hypothetical protein